uniref:S-formylglutathione hydrolase n=1 Tax=Panagrellus redivivus TaxID=6233 RepID=A0A7E4UNK4_PANRE
MTGKSVSVLKEVSSVKSFGGTQKVFEFESKQLKCTTRIGVYLPAEASEAGAKLPALFYLSGLTCTEANFIEKSGFQRYAAQHKLIVINPDTSPRGVKIEGDDDGWDFGTGAGFYVDATEPKWANNYRMYSYVVEELTAVVGENFPVNTERFGITGHSMGGHGAFTIALKNPTLFKSVSAFAPISNPTKAPWGLKAFTGYLGKDTETWKAYDATELAANYKGPAIELYLDQGDADNFYKQAQLLPENLAAVNNPLVNVKFNLRPGYDHSYYFIATFVGDHFEYHAKILNA